MLRTEIDAVEHDEIVFYEGKADGKAEDLCHLMRELKITFEQAAKVLHIAPDEYALYQKAIAEM